MNYIQLIKTLQALRSNGFFVVLSQQSGSFHQFKIDICLNEDITQEISQQLKEEYVETRVIAG